jgi:hypothetical protein
MTAKFAWSNSVVAMYEVCPKQYFHVKVAKDAKDEDTSFAHDGKVVHDALKSRVIDGKPFPLPLRYLEGIAAKFATAEGEKYGEMKLCLNDKYEPVDFFAKDAWVRSIIDLLIIKGDRAIIVDWKTGKTKEGFTQLELTAAMLARYMPEIAHFTVVYVWLKEREITKRMLTLSMLPDVWNGWLARIRPILEARKTTSFPARPSKMCDYCPVKQCPHYGNR